jgi:acyl-CoA dehydrogenase
MMTTTSQSSSSPLAIDPLLSPFTQEHETLRESIRVFLMKEMVPHTTEWEEARWYPNEVFKQFAEHGYLGLKYPVQYGGEGGDHLDEAVLLEELAYCQLSGVDGGVGAHIGIATAPVFTYGTEEQKQRYLVPAITGDKIGALAVTEPDAGSDVAAMRTHAKKVDGGWLVNGSKMFITNGVRANFVVTAVKTTDQGGHHGISFLIIDTDQTGYQASKLDKLGYHSSDTAAIGLTDVFVPEDNLLGTLNEGFYQVMANFTWERLVMALGATATMRRLFETTLEYALQRRAFGRPIGSFQVIRHKFADMAMRIEGARAVTYNALRLFHSGRDASKEAAMAKLTTQRAAFEIADQCLQIHGGNGYMVEYGIERVFRDSRLGTIAGGTDEIMREIVGKSLGL